MTKPKEQLQKTQ